MLEELRNLQKKGIYISVLISLLWIFLSGIFFGVTYFVMDEIHNEFLTQDCVINDNTLVSSCQELFELALYPFLILKDILIWVSFFFIFGLVIAMLILGYRSGSSAVMLGVMVSFVGGITYLGILFSNIYRALIEQVAFRSIMIPFTVYNKIMLNFPWFIFFVGLFSVILGIINFQKTSVNTPTGELNY